MNNTDHPTLSIIIPAYNEAVRLPATLKRITEYLGRRSFNAEIIVVDDGSGDETANVAERFNCSNVRVLRLPHRGKARAVQAGVFESRGVMVLFTDADLSTPIEHVERLLQAMDAGADIAIGSREVALARRMGEPPYRHLMGRVFNRLVQALVVPGISDSQCGFKLFRREVAIDVFSRARLHQSSKVVRGPRVTAFDVEILFIARQRGYRIDEVPVNWTHVSGSKVNPVVDSIRMFADVLRVKFNDLRGRYD